MDIDFLTVLITVCSLVVLAVPGFIFAKIKLIPQNTASILSNIVLYCCQPVLMFNAFQKTSFDARIGVNMLIVLGVSFVVHFVMIALVCLIMKDKGVDKKVACVRFASVFSNCGFMGFPFLQALFGGDKALLGEILIYGAVVNAVFTILTWTVGVYMMSKDKKQVSLKKIITTPSIIATVLGFLVFLIVKVPLVDLATQGGTLDFIIEKFMMSLGYISEMITPLSMFVIGTRLANVSFKRMVINKNAYITSIFKLVVMSLVSMLAVAFLPVSITVKYTVFFLLSMPSATNSVLYATRFDKDADEASIYVLTTTILCILTIPLMFLAFSGIVGI